LIAQKYKKLLKKITKASEKEAEDTV